MPTTPKPRRAARTVTVAAAILACLLTMAAYTVPAGELEDAGTEVAATDTTVESTDVSKAEAPLAAADVSEPTTAAVDSVTEAATQPVDVAETVDTVVDTVEEVAEAVPAPAPEAPAAPKPAPKVVPEPAPEPAPEPTDAPASTDDAPATSPSAPAPTSSAPDPAPAPTNDPGDAGAQSPAPADAGDANAGRTGPAADQRAERTVAAAGDSVTPQPAGAHLSSSDRAALQASNVGSRDGGSSSPVLQPLAAPPEGGLPSVLAPQIAPPSITGMSKLSPDSRWAAGPISLPSGADTRAWLLSTALGLLVLTAAGHAARVTAARRRARA